MDSLSYETMMSAHTNPALPGENLGGLGGRAADVQPVYLVPGLALAAWGVYHIYTTRPSEGAGLDYAAICAMGLAGGLLSNSIN